MAWEEIKDERKDMYKFEQVGSVIEGELIDKKQAKFGNAYAVKLRNGTIVQFFGTTMLDGLLSRVEVGKIIKIIYDDEQKSKEGRLFKSFRVFCETPNFEVLK